MSRQIRIVKVDNVAIDENTLVKVKRMGNQTQLSHRWKVPIEMPIERISDTEYLVKKTGEIKEYKKSKTRDEQIGHLRTTFKKLRELINTNFIGQPNEKFITLTYAENMQDVERLQRDFQIWMKSVRRKYGKCDYINVVEPQERGAWHCHVLIKFYELENGYLDYDEFRKLWKYGYNKVKELNDIDNIGAYLSAYLTDIEMTDETFEQATQDMDAIEIRTVEFDDGQSKKFIKGGRLHYYPSAMKLYRRSKGIKDPVVYVTIKKDFIESIDDMELVNSSKYDVVSDDKVVNFTSYENYAKVKKGHKKSLHSLATVVDKRKK